MEELQDFTGGALAPAGASKSRSKHFRAQLREDVLEGFRNEGRQLQDWLSTWALAFEEKLELNRQRNEQTVARQHKCLMEALETQLRRIGTTDEGECAGDAAAGSGAEAFREVVKAAHMQSKGRIERTWTKPDYKAGTAKVASEPEEEGPGDGRRYTVAREVRASEEESPEGGRHLMERPRRGAPTASARVAPHDAAALHVPSGENLPTQELGRGDEKMAESVSVVVNPSAPRASTGSNRRAMPAQEQKQYVSKTLNNLARHTSRAGETKVQHVVHSTAFEVLSIGFIVANTLCMAVELQHKGLDDGYRIGADGYDRPVEEIWPHAGMVLIVLDFVFNSIFTLELACRTIAMGKRVASCPWMWFDFLVVMVCWLDRIGTTAVDFDASVMRLVRLARLVRIQRVLSHIAAFDSLFLLMKSIRASLSATVWSFIVLLVMQISMGMCMSQMLNTFMMDESQDKRVRLEVFNYFGTFTKTMLTMFEITLANWVPSCRLLAEHVSEWYVMWYVFYRCMFCFTVLKVITAVFISETNRVLESDDAVAITKKRRARAKFQDKLRTVFHEVDADNCGSVTWEEFETILDDELIRTWLSTLDISTHDCHNLFEVLDDNGDGRITQDEFLAGVSIARGVAKSTDIMTQQRQLEKIERTLNAIVDAKGLP